MGIRGELFTTEISLDNRTYFFNVKENRTGDVFLQVVESKNAEGAGFDRHAIVVFEDDMQKFLQGLENSLKYIEKNRKNRIKEQADKTGPAKKKVVRSGRGEQSAQKDSIPPAPKKPGRRVTVISKKDQKKA